MATFLAAAVAVALAMAGLGLGPLLGRHGLGGSCAGCRRCDATRRPAHPSTRDLEAP